MRTRPNEIATLETKQIDVPEYLKYSLGIEHA